MLTLGIIENSLLVMKVWASDPQLLLVACGSIKLSALSIEETRREILELGGIDNIFDIMKNSNFDQKLQAQSSWALWNCTISSSNFYKRLTNIRCFQ
jgi:hypothetical protein